VPKAHPPSPHQADVLHRIAPRDLPSTLAIAGPSA
jgi:hypothetical protein